MFPLRNDQDQGKLVYIFSDRVPKGKSQSLTSKWLGPARIDSVVSNILAIVTTQYRKQRFGKPERTQAFTIDRLYPFLSAHDVLCSADAPNSDDLVSTVHSTDYQPKDGEIQEENKEDEGAEHPLTKDLGEAAHFLPDEFCEAVRPDPEQQVKLTSQEHVPFAKTWADILEIDDRLLLNDIIPPGNHGERWQNTTTRAALERHAREVQNYERKKMSPDVNHENEANGLDKQTSPAQTTSMFQTVPPDDPTSVSGPVTSHHDDVDIDENNDNNLDDNNDNNLDDNNDNDTSIFRHHETQSEQQEKTDEARAKGKDNRGDQHGVQEGAGGPQGGEDHDSAPGARREEGGEESQERLPDLPRLQDNLASMPRRRLGRDKTTGWRQVERLGGDGTTQNQQQSKQTQQLLRPTAAQSGSQPQQSAQPDNRVKHHQQQQGEPRLSDRGRGRGGGGGRGSSHSLLQRFVLPHSSASPTRPTASTAAQPEPTHPGRAAAARQLGPGPRTPEVPYSQHLLHRVERRGKHATSSPSSPLDSRSTSTSRNSPRIWSPNKVDWTQINREAAAAAKLQQRIVDRFEEEEQLQQHQQQQQKVRLLIQTPEHKISDQIKQTFVLSKRGRELASGVRLPRKAKTLSSYQPKSTSASNQASRQGGGTQQPKVLPLLSQGAQGGRPAEPVQVSTDKPGQHQPPEQQQLKARASGWLRTALGGRRKK